MTDTPQNAITAPLTVAEAAAEATRKALADDMAKLTGAYHAFTAIAASVAGRVESTLHLKDVEASLEKAFTSLSLHVHEVTSTSAEPAQAQLALAPPEEA